MPAKGPALARLARYENIPAAAMAQINAWAHDHGWGAVPQDVTVYHGALRAADTPVCE